MKVPFFDLGTFIRNQKPQVMASIERVVDSGSYIGGKEVESFEAAFAESVGTSICVGVGNGLDAIRLLLEAHRIGPGDEVIVPGFTFYATWLAVLQVGATPVAVDVKLSTASIDPEKIREAVNTKTKAVLVVHLFGISVDMLAVNKIAKQHGLLVFEDCAQAHFGQTNLGPVGNSSDGGAFSFYPTKNLGALGDAGAITLNDKHIAQILRSRRSYGVGSNKYEHIDTGWNSRLDPIQAGILSTFLPGLVDVTEKRRLIASRYLDALEGSKLLAVNADDLGRNVFHHFVIRSKNRERTRSSLLEKGVESDIHYPYYFNSVLPLASMASAVENANHRLKNSEALSNQVVSLPIGPWMSEEQIDHVCSALRHVAAIE